MHNFSGKLYFVIEDEVVQHRRLGKELRQNEDALDLMPFGFQIQLIHQQLLIALDGRNGALVLPVLLRVDFLECKQPFLGGQREERRTY